MGDEGSGVDLFYSFAGAFGNAVFLWSVSDAMKAITDRIWTAIPKDGLPGAGVLVAVKYARARNPNPDLPGTTDYVKGAQVVAGGHNPVGSTFAKTEARKFYDQPKIDVNVPETLPSGSRTRPVLSASVPESRTSTCAGPQEKGASFPS